MNTDLQFIYDPMPVNDFAGGGGICYRDRLPGTIVDTLVIHSCHVEEPIIHPVLADSLDLIGENFAIGLMQDWYTAKERESRAADEQERRQCAATSEALKCAALHVLIRARRGEAGLTPFHRAAIKDIFEFNGVSAHYLLDRDGEIFELVSPDKHCFHAGDSRLPLADDAREAVNDFSIGIELMGTFTSGFTDLQYKSLTALSEWLLQRYPIDNIFGHADIALPRGRKTDPWLFDWGRFKRDLKYKERSLRFP